MLNEIDLSRADLNLLALFEVVLEERHVGRAAERTLLTRVISTAEPFDAARSARRFTIGAPDGVSAVLLPPLFAHIRRKAPRIDVGVRNLLPARMTWETSLVDLDARAIDIAILPIDDVPARFIEHTLYEEDFVVATRAGHQFAEAPTLERYCQMLHLVVSITGDSHAFVDETLAKQGLSRRVALTVPNFMLALALIAQTDLIAALPRRFVAMHAARFGVTSSEAPLPLSLFRIRAIAPRVAMMDAGLAWLFDVLAEAAQVAVTARRRSRKG